MPWYSAAWMCGMVSMVRHGIARHGYVSRHGRVSQHSVSR